MSQKKTGSLTEEAYHTLRSDILACRLRPDEKLIISDLCTRLGVSLGAVREALSRLTSEGLVTSEPHKGFKVAPVTMAELEDITKVRTKIESLCLESAIANADLKWETAIVSTTHELSRIPLQDPNDPARVSEIWTEAHKRYHEALVANCDSDWMLKIREILFAQSERYRQFSVPLDRTTRDIAAEHRAIADAAIDRDASLACELLRQHLTRTTRILLDANLAAPQGAK